MSFFTQITTPSSITNGTSGAWATYYNSDGSSPPRPAILVSGSIPSGLANLQLPDVVAVLYACALPEGTAAPTDSTDLLANYTNSINTYTTPTNVTKTGQVVVANMGVIHDVQATPGSVSSGKLPISGNTNYDVYATWVARVKGGTTLGSKLISSSTMITIPSVRTYAPIPNVTTDIDSTITNEADMIASVPIETFEFTFTPPIKYFSNLEEFTSSSPTPANFGYGRITCSGDSAQAFYPVIWDGTTSSSPIYDYISGVHTTSRWKVPKFVSGTANYDGYTFTATYINASGVESTPTSIRYTPDMLRTLGQSSINENSKGEWSLRDASLIRVGDHRRRLAIGISDIDLESIKYKTKGSFISKPYACDFPLYAVSIEATEQIPRNDVSALTPWDFIKYYLQFGNVEDSPWIRISPRERSYETDGSAQVPSVIILDTLMNETDTTSLSNTKFVSINKPVYNFRVRIDMDVSSAASRQLWSPIVYDYKVLVLGRDLLSTGSVERYLFI